MTEETKQEVLQFDTMQIMEMIPHRYPFLLVDRITECVPGKYAKGYKNMTMNEQFFQGHFPPEFKGKLTLYAGVDGVRFKNIVRPGDRFDMEIELTKVKGPICKAHGIGKVDGKVCVEADMTFALK